MWLVSAEGDDPFGAETEKKPDVDARLLLISLLPLFYRMEGNYYANYFQVFLAWKGFGLLELMILEGFEGLDKVLGGAVRFANAHSCDKAA
jgi:hypothetical protein